MDLCLSVWITLALNLEVNMFSIGAIVLFISVLTQFIFVGHETPKHEPSKHEIDARWENVA